MHRRTIAFFTILMSAGGLVLLQCVGDSTVTPNDGGNDSTSSDGPSADSKTDSPASDGGDAAPLPSGMLDTTFKNGIITGVQMTPYAVAVDSQGLIYIAGTAACTNLPADAAYSNNDMVVARFLATGDVDTTYGTGGRACVPIGNGTLDTATGIGIDPNGKAVIAGSEYVNNSDFGGTTAVARLTTAGVPDPTFGSSGHMLSIYGSPFHARILFDGGFIYVVGNQSLGKGIVLKLDATGAPVSSFGDAGLRLPDAGLNGAVFTNPNVFGAGWTAATGPSSIVVEGFAATNGANAGLFTFALSDGGADYARDIGVSGTSYLVSATIGVRADSGTFDLPLPNGQLAAFKMTSSGAIDTTWAAPSGIFVSQQLMAFRAEVRTALVQPGGQLVLAGLIDATEQVTSWSGDGALTRVTTSGTLDTTFGTSGITRLGTNHDTYVIDTALDPRNGAIVVIGGQGSNVILERLTP